MAGEVGDQPVRIHPAAAIAARTRAPRRGRRPARPGSARKPGTTAAPLRCRQRLPCSDASRGPSARPASHREAAPAGSPRTVTTHFPNGARQLPTRKPSPASVSRSPRSTASGSINRDSCDRAGPAGTDAGGEPGLVTAPPEAGPTSRAYLRSTRDRAAGPGGAGVRVARSTFSTSSLRPSTSTTTVSPSRSSDSGPPEAASGQACPTIRPRGGAAEPPVGDQRDGLAQALADQRGRDQQHLPHARATARALVADHDGGARLDPPAENRLARVLLAVEDLGRTAVEPRRLRRHLHHRPVRCQVPGQDAEAPPGHQRGIGRHDDPLPGAGRASAASSPSVRPVIVGQSGSM